MQLETLTRAQAEAEQALLARHARETGRVQQQAFAEGLREAAQAMHAQLRNPGGGDGAQGRSD